MTEGLPPGWVETTLADVVARPRSKVSPEDHPELAHGAAANVRQLRGLDRERLDRIEANRREG